MDIFKKLKRIFIKKTGVRTIININDILPIPSRETFKNDFLIDKYKSEYFDILSTRQTLLSKNLSSNFLDKEINMNTDLLIHIYKFITDENTSLCTFKEEFEVNNMIWLIKMEIYLKKLKELEDEILARLIALKELLDIRKLKRNKQAIMEEINHLSFNRAIVEVKMNAIKNDTKNHLKYFEQVLSNDEISFKKRESIKKYKYERLLELLIELNPQKAREISMISKNIIVKIALFECELEIYCYKNQEEINLLNQELDNLRKDNISSKNTLLEKIKIIERKYLMFYEYGKNVTENDLLNLYRLKFKILSIDIYNDENAFSNVFANTKEGECYYQIIMEKINDILLGKNIFVNNLFGKDSSKAIKLITSYLKSWDGNNEYNPNIILFYPKALNLLISFDSSYGFKSYLRSLYGRKDKNWYLSPILTDTSPFKWEESLPLETYCFIRCTQKTHPENLPTRASFKGDEAIFDLYDLMKKNETSDKYYLPEGLVSINLDTYYEMNEFNRGEQRRTFFDRVALNSCGKKVILPSSLKQLSGNIFNRGPISDIILNDGLEYIGDGTLKGHNLKSLVIPSSLKRINFEDIKDSVETLVFNDFKNSKILNDDDCLSELIESFITGSCDVSFEEKHRKYEVTNFIRGLKKIILIDENNNIFLKIDTKDLRVKNVYCVNEMYFLKFNRKSEAQKIVNRLKDIIQNSLNALMTTKEEDSIRL